MNWVLLNKHINYLSAAYHSSAASLARNISLLTCKVIKIITKQSYKLALILSYFHKNPLNFRHRSYLEKVLMCEPIYNFANDRD